MNHSFLLPATLTLALAGTALAAADTGPGKRLHAAHVTTHDKISASLKTQAETGEMLPVLIVLKDQPQKRIFRRHEGSAEMRLRIAHGNFRQLASHFASEQRLREAHHEIDRVSLDIREASAREIEMTIGPEQQLLSGQLTGMGAIQIERYRATNTIAAVIPSSALPILEADERIEHVFLAEQHSVTAAPAMPFGMNTAVLGAPTFWKAGLTGAGQSVVVIDTGIAPDHPAFAGKALVNRVFLSAASKLACFADDASSALDRVGHGTHVAGIVASQGTSSLPAVQGVAKGITTLYTLKAGARLSGTQGCGPNTFMDQDILSALEWAIFNSPVKILNMSFGANTNQDDTGLARLIDQLADTYGLTIAVAAGNNGANGLRTVGSPGIGYNIISVANWDTHGSMDKRDDSIIASSSKGPTAAGRFKPDVAAPGTSILSADYNSAGFVEMTGTSMASPHIAGAAALLYQAGQRTPLEVKATLINTTDNYGWDSASGWGYVNLDSAATAAAPLTGTVGPASGAGAFRFFRGDSAGDFYSTLVLNRHISGNKTAFHDLDLMVYNRTSQALLETSDSALQNVEQVAIDFDGAIVLKVRSVSSTFGLEVASEPFALAVSQDGFVPASGPALRASCTGPATVAPGASFSVSCQTANSGDLDVPGVRTEFNYRSGTGGQVSNLGNLAPSQTRTNTYSVVAPNAPGAYTLVYAARGQAYEEVFSGSATYTYQVK